MCVKLSDTHFLPCAGEGGNCLDIPDVYWEGAVTAPVLAPGLTNKPVPALAELETYKYLFDDEQSDLPNVLAVSAAREQVPTKREPDTAPVSRELMLLSDITANDEDSDGRCTRSRTSSRLRRSRANIYSLCES